MCVKVLEDRLKKNYSDLNPNADFSSFRLSFQSKKGHSSRIEFFLEYNDYENIWVKKNLISKEVSSTLVHPEKGYCYKS